MVLRMESCGPRISEPDDENIISFSGYAGKGLSDHIFFPDSGFSSPIPQRRQPLLMPLQTGLLA